MKEWVVILAAPNKPELSELVTPPGVKKILMVVGNLQYTLCLILSFYLMK